MIYICVEKNFQNEPTYYVHDIITFDIIILKKASTILNTFLQLFFAINKLLYSIDDKDHINM